MKFGRRTRALLALALVVGASVAVAPSGSPATVSAAPVCTGLCAGGEYHPIAQPLRIFETRSSVSTGTINDVAPLGRKPFSTPGTSVFNVDLLGLGNPSFVHPWLTGTEVANASDVLAVVANVTVVNPSAGGYLVAFAAGATEPTASLLNFVSTTGAVANLAILRPDANGMLSIGLRGPPGASADVLIDVFGWFSSSTYMTADGTSYRGARLVPIDPARLADTRLVPGAPVGPLSSLHVPIRGAMQMGTAAPTPPVVPDDPNVVGVVLNVTGVQPAARTFLSALPADPAGVPPGTSNVNLVAGMIKANLVIVPVNPATGDVWIYNNAGSTHVVVDVVGYLLANVDEATRAGRVVPLTTPFRTFDTRSPLFGSAPLGPRQAEDWSFADFAGSVNIGGVAVGNQSALIGNLTNASLARSNPLLPVGSYLTVYPSPGGPGVPPKVSNLNSVDTLANGYPVPNMALVRYGANATVRVYNFAGYAHYLLDASAVVLAD